MPPVLAAITPSPRLLIAILYQDAIVVIASSDCHCRKYLQFNYLRTAASTSSNVNSASVFQTFLRAGTTTFPEAGT